MAAKQRFQVIPAVFMIFRRDGKTLFLRRANTGYGDGSYSLPAGHLDGGESAIMAAMREAKEEIGITLTRDSLRLVHMLHRQITPGEEKKHERVDFFFEITEWEGEPVNAEPQKCDELLWADADNLPKPMTSEVEAMFKALAKGELYSDFNF